MGQSAGPPGSEPPRQCFGVAVALGFVVGFGLVVGFGDGTTLGAAVGAAVALGNVTGTTVRARNGESSGSRMATRRSSPAAFCGSGAGGVAPVVGPQVTRMLSPTIAIGSSPWVGFSPFFHCVTWSRASVVLYWATSSGQPMNVALIRLTGSPFSPVTALFATIRRPPALRARNT